jgi:hypothetical protein
LVDAEFENSSGISKTWRKSALTSPQEFALTRYGQGSHIGGLGGRWGEFGAMTEAKCFGL